MADRRLARRNRQAAKAVSRQSDLQIGLQSTQEADGANEQLARFPAGNLPFRMPASVTCLRDPACAVQFVEFPENRIVHGAHPPEKLPGPGIL